MRENPDATIGEWAESIGRSRSSTASGLHRLHDAGLIENEGKTWRVLEQQAPRETPKWAQPVRGSDRSAHPHLTA